MALDSIPPTYRSCFVLLSGCIPARNSKGPASDWLPSSASSTVTVAGFGPRARRTVAPLFISLCSRGELHEPSVETSIARRNSEASHHRGLRRRYRSTGDGAETRRLFSSLPA